MLLAASGVALAKDPDCAGLDHWPARAVFTELKNAGEVTEDQIDLSRSTVRLINSTRVGKDQYRQVHLVRYRKKTGEVIEAIVVNEASHEECSASEADIYYVSHKTNFYSDEMGRPVPYDPGPAGKAPLKPKAANP